MIAESLYKKVLLIFFMPLVMFAQEDTNETETETKVKKDYKTEFYNLRGTNVFDVAIGTSVIDQTCEERMILDSLTYYSAL